MRTAFITHPDCLGHDIGHDHPESPSRLRAIDDRLHAADLYHFLRHYDAPQVTREQLLRVHDGEYLDELERMQPETDIVQLDQDTALMSKSLLAARRAAGAVIMGVELVTAGEVNNVFCCVRPPGHHAEHNRAMGFCIYANAAIGAAHALNSLGLERVAVVDFDVHHGNGTEALFRDDERVMVCSTFQHPFYPDTPFEENGTRIINVPLKAGSTGGDFKEAVLDHWLPALNNFKPELVIVSAGFDAHLEDDMAGLRFVERDYAWVTVRLLEVAETHAAGRLVSVLEGGYVFGALGRSAEAHVRALMHL